MRIGQFVALAQINGSPTKIEMSLNSQNIVNLVWRGQLLELLFGNAALEVQPQACLSLTQKDSSRCSLSKNCGLIICFSRSHLIAELSKNLLGASSQAEQEGWTLPE